MAADTATSTDNASPSPTDLKASEAEYLSDQAAQAKAAIGRTLAELKAELAHAASAISPVELTRQRPWIALGVTAFAGFAAAVAAVPSREQQALSRLAKLEAALRPPPPSPKPEANGKHAEPKSTSPKWLHTLIAEVVKSVGPMLGTLVGNLVAPPPPDSNAAVTPPPTAPVTPPTAR